MKKRPPFNQNAAVRSAIRRVFSRSPIVREVMWKVRREVPKFNKDGSRAKKNAVQYQCNVCSVWTKSTAIAVDHIIPVISVLDGFIDWNTFVQRLFCDASNLQVVCNDCHQKKTNEERFARQYKEDLEMVFHFEMAIPNASCREEHIQVLEDAKKKLAKFNKKRLPLYPADFVDRVLKLKLLVKGRKLLKKT